MMKKPQGSMQANPFLELAEQPSVSLGTSQAANRSSGFDLAFSRMKNRRIGGTFVQDDVPLHVLDVIPKGNYPRSTAEDRFVRPGSARFIAAQLIGQDALEELEKDKQALEKLRQEEEDERNRKIAEEMAALEAAAEEERRIHNEGKARVNALSEEWESGFYDPSAEQGLPTDEELEQTARLKAEATDRGIPSNLLEQCILPSEVEELIEIRKQFSEIDVDRSGKLDTFEMKTALAKLGVKLDEQQLNALLGTSDSSGDGEVDFEEFVLLIRGFQSSVKERTHQGKARGSMAGLADAARNMEIVMEETEFGSKVVVKRREIKEWENYMQFPDPLHWAAGKGDLKALEQFIKEKDGAPEITADWINKDGKMAIHYAAIWNQVHIIKFLLEPCPHGAGVGVDPPDVNHNTPLLLAAENGSSEACEILVRSWANPCQRNLVGATALHYACAKGHTKILASVLSAGAIVSASEDETIRLWSVKEPAAQRILASDRKARGPRAVLGPACCMQVFQDRVVTGHQDGTIMLSSVSTQQASPYGLRDLQGTWVFEGHAGTVLCLSVQHSDSTTPGRLMVSGSEDHSVRLWDMPTGRCLEVYRDTRPAQHPSAVVSVDLDVLADRVVAGTRGGIVLIWRLSDAEFLHALLTHIGSPVNAIQLDGNTLLSASNDRTIRLWDISVPRSRLFGGNSGNGPTGHRSAVRCAVRVDQDTSFDFPFPECIVSGSHAGEIFIWEVPATLDNVEDPVALLTGAGGTDTTAFAGPVFALKVCNHGDMKLIFASSTAENGIAVWKFSGRTDNDILRRFTGHTGDVWSLAWYGPNLNLCDPTGVSPLMMAAEEGQEQALAVLLGCVGVNPWIGDAQHCETALHRAARNGHAGCMRLLLEYDPMLITAATDDLSSVLHRSVEHELRGPDCVDVALQYGAEINLLNSHGDGALHVAVRMGRYKALKRLLSFTGPEGEGPDLNLVGSDFPIGGLPLGRPPNAVPEHRFPALQKLPVQYQTVAIARVLAPSKSKAGAHAIRGEVVTKHRLLRHPHGWTPLHEAAAFGRSACVKLLLDSKANANVLDNTRRTPLHLACANGSADQVKLLLDAKGDLQARDALGCTALHYAVKVGQEEAVKMLVSVGGKGFNLDIAEQVDGLTALHMAAKYGFEEICFVLLSAGADVNLVDHRLNSPLHYAVCGAIGMRPEPSVPQIPTKVAALGFDVNTPIRVRNWLELWRENLLSMKGFSDDRLRELKEESLSKFGKFTEAAQVLLDGFARFDLMDSCGKTARDYAAQSMIWGVFSTMFAACSPDGTAFLVKGDHVMAVYLGEQGTRFEHPNLWQMVSCFGVRCAYGMPRLSGSRAFRRSESRFGKQEVEYRDLGQLKTGEAGELLRDGCAVYVLGLEFEDQATGARRQAHAHLCCWASGPRTFETKYNALVTELVEGETYALRVVSVDELEP